MANGAVQWLIPIVPIITLILGYILGNWKAKRDKLLEKRTEIFENIFRFTSNLMIETVYAKAIEVAMKEVKKTGIGKLFEEEHDKLILDSMRENAKNELERMGVDVEEKDVDIFIEKFLMSLIMGFHASLEFKIYQTQLGLDEEVMALQIYLSPKMRNKLKKISQEMDDHFDKFYRNEIDYQELHDKASEFAKRVNEIMKLRP